VTPIIGGTRIDGGPTDLENLALVCREHHRAVHEGGWRLARGPDDRFRATPGQRTRRPTGDIPPPPDPGRNHRARWVHGARIIPPPAPGT